MSHSCIGIVQAQETHTSIFLFLSQRFQIFVYVYSDLVKGDILWNQIQCVVFQLAAIVCILDALPGHWALILGTRQSPRTPVVFKGFNSVTAA